MAGKTILVATYPDGRRHVIRKREGMWEWRPGACSSHLAAAKEQLAAEGATITREPNPHYKPTTGPTNSEARSLLRGMFPKSGW